MKQDHHATVAPQICIPCLADSFHRCLLATQGPEDIMVISFYQREVHYNWGELKNHATQKDRGQHPRTQARASFSFYGTYLRVLISMGLTSKTS